MPDRAAWTRSVLVALAAATLTASCSTGATEAVAQLGDDAVPHITSSAPAATEPPAVVPAADTEPSDTGLSDAGLSDIGEFEPVFFDDFEGTELDPAIWGFESPLLGANDDSVHIYEPEAVTVADGILSITASRLATPLAVDSDDDGMPDRDITWRSGFVTSRDRLSFTYGRFEIRARLPEGQGLWPAFWLRPQDRTYGRWPASGEIDVFESLGHEPSTIHFTAHWSDEGHQKAPASVELAPTEDGFRTFAVEWTPTSLRWMVDGTVYHELDEWPSDVGDAPSPFDAPFYLNINLAVGGSWPGQPDATTPEGATLDVDWVRVSALR